MKQEKNLTILSFVTIFDTNQINTKINLQG